MDQSLKNNHSIKATVTAIKGGKAILILEDNQILFWPSHLLPQGIKVGSDIYLTLDAQGFQGQEQKNLARALLNEILGS